MKPCAAGSVLGVEDHERPLRAPHRQGGLAAGDGDRVVSGHGTHHRACVRTPSLRLWRCRRSLLEGLRLCRLSSSALHGVDLTVSTMRAHHNGGPQNREFYDTNFGRAMYADGDEALGLLPLGSAEHQRGRPGTRDPRKGSIAAHAGDDAGTGRG